MTTRFDFYYSQSNLAKLKSLERAIFRLSLFLHSLDFLFFDHVLASMLRLLLLASLATLGFSSPTPTATPDSLPQPTPPLHLLNKRQAQPTSSTISVPQTAP